MKIEISFKQLKGWWRQKRRLLLIVALVLVALALLGVIAKIITEKRSKDLTLAVVNGHRIRVSDFKKQMAAVPEFYQAYVAGNRSQFLQDLIDRELVYQKARRSGYGRSREIEARLAELKKDFLVQEYVQKEILNNPNVPEKDMRQYYKSQPMDFVQPASVQLSEIIVSDRKVAENIIERYRKGENFEDLARKYSEAPSKGRGGNLGFVREGKLPEQLARIAFGMSPGQISAPIQTETGYYLLLAGQNIPSRQLSYEESIPLLKKIMQSKSGENNFKDSLVRLRAKSKIKMMGANLEKMEF
ncbi:MAG: peptidyl-prolyl cis-trans isomerase [Candidatus Omnitrophica bacterium]|nr:peptidyl-prolyl cis-trans isomerase [Candidatus Omnitrophota bacterium]